MPPPVPTRTPAPPARRPRWPWALAGGVAALLLAALGAVMGLHASLRSEQGTAWWLGHLPGVSVTHPQGPLLGDFSADAVQLVWAGGQLNLSGLRWQGLSLGWSNAPGAWLALHAAALTVDRLEQTATPNAPEAASPPLSAPRHLRLPVTLQIDRLQLGELRLAALGSTPLNDLQARVALGEGDGARHRIDLAGVGRGPQRLSGSFEVATEGDLALDVQLALSALPPPAGQVGPPTLQGQLQLSGPLASPALTASLTTPPGNGPVSAGASLHAQARLLPFAAWPLATLDAQLARWDLSLLALQAPRTALSGTLKLASHGPNQPAQLTVDLANASAGRWGDGRLPVRRLQLSAQARPDQPALATLNRLLADLGTASQAAGQLQLAGENTAQGWALRAQLDGVWPALLDARAPALRLDGPLTLSGQGLDATAAQSLRVQSELRGRSASGAGEAALSVNADGERSPAGALALRLTRLALKAGAAQATLTGQLQRADAAAPWRLQANGALADFDPLLWWPGGASAKGRPAPTTLNGQANATLQWQPTAPATTPGVDVTAAWRALLGGLTGKAQVQLERSRLAGLPLSGQLDLLAQASGGRATGALALGDNRLGLDADAANATQGSDQARLRLRAPALQQLAPVSTLLTSLGLLPAGRAPAGQVTAQATVKGRWPALSSEGSLAVRGLQWGPGSVREADLAWQLGTAADAPTTLDLKARQLGWPGATLDSADATLRGSTRAHQLALQAQGRRVDSGSGKPGPAALLALRLQGGLAHGQAALAVAPQGGPTSAWRGQLDRLTLGAVGSAPWVQAEGLTMSLQGSADALALALQPGQVALRWGDSASALRWTRAEAQLALAGDHPGRQYALQATLDPLAVAPLLAQLQPGFGWGGDLLVKGKLDLHSQPSPSADIVLERQGGDLAITDDDGTQALGLSDLRLGLNASGGVWNFTQAVAGQSLGVAAGAVVARTAPDAPWPDADTPVQGVVELQVANLAAWASWVPAGWRLGGMLQSSASIAGKLGAPEFTGRLRGQGLTARHVLQGVNITDGELALSMTGERAVLERFSAKAGPGTLNITGQATLGAQPSATLNAVADRFQALGRVDLRVLTSGNAQLRLAPNQLALDGRLVVDEGLIDISRADAPSLSSDVVVLRPPGVGAPNAPPPLPPPSAAARAFVLNLAVGLGEQLRLKGRGLDTRLQGDLKLSAPGGSLAVLGTVRTVGGNYAAYGQKLRIDRGALAFSGPPDNPRLDIEATRPQTDIRVGVVVSGSALSPRVRLFSEPELPEVDKLSWLVLGRASSGLGRTDTALLQRAAVALFAGEEEGAVTRLTKAIGLDEVSLRQTDGEVRETFVTLGKQLSERLYLGYERGVNSTAGSFQLIYRIAQRLTLRGQAGADNAVDAVYTWRWK